MGPRKGEELREIHLIDAEIELDAEEIARFYCRKDDQKTIAGNGGDHSESVEEAHSKAYIQVDCLLVHGSY